MLCLSGFELYSRCVPLKTAVKVTKKVCHVTKKLTLNPFCLHKKSHFGKIFVSKQPLENRIRLESNFELDFFGGSFSIENFPYMLLRNIGKGSPFWLRLVSLLDLKL